MAGRRWLWPCCRLGWDEDHEFGLPLEATFLACVASLEKGAICPDSSRDVVFRDCHETGSEVASVVQGELFHSAVSPRDCGSVEGNAEEQYMHTLLYMT